MRRHVILVGQLEVQSSTGRRTWEIRGCTDLAGSEGLEGMNVYNIQRLFRLPEGHDVIVLASRIAERAR